MKSILIIFVFFFIVIELSFAQDYQTLSGHRGNVNSLTFSADGKTLASSGSDGRVILWDVNTGSKLDEINMGDNVTSVRYSPNDKYIGVTTLKGNASLIDPKTGSIINKFPEKTNCYSISFSKDNKYIAVTYIKMTDGSKIEFGIKVDTKKYQYFADVYSASNFSLVKTLNVHEEDIVLGLFVFNTNILETYRADMFNTVFTNDSKYLAIPKANGHIGVYSFDKGSFIKDFTGHNNKVNNICISPDGNYFATASNDENVRTWNISTGKKIQTLKDHSASVNSVCFSPDSKFLASGGDDGKVILWNASTGKQIKTLKGGKSEVISVAFSPDGRYVISANSDEKIRVWKTETILPELKEFAERFNTFYSTDNTNFSSEKEKLSSNVNSPYGEIAPVISPDGKTLYFTRDSHPDNLGYKKLRDDQDIWVSEQDAFGNWTFAKNLSYPLNNQEPNNAFSVTPDGNTLLIGNVYKSDGRVVQGISFTYKSSTGWTFPEEIKIPDYSNNSNYHEFSLSNSGKIIIMSVQRNDGYGERDLYATFRNDIGEWSKPLNLGSNINSNKEDFSPFLASDETTLYYSSMGKGGFGDADLFVARRLDDTWQNWSEPENMGEIINTQGFDAYYFIPASGDFAYFVSGDDGSSDIHRIRLPESVRPDPVLLVSGKVLNRNTLQPVEARIYYEVLPEGNEAGIARTNPINGEYKITLPPRKKYGFRAEADGYISINDNIDASDISEYGEIERNLYLVPIEVGEIVTLNNIFFDFGKFDLKDESFPELRRVVEFLSANSNVTIEISGHTDNVGSDDYNQELSENRAMAVYNFLTQNNISSPRVTYKGYGRSSPVATNDTEEGRKQNRRVEFKIISK